MKTNLGFWPARLGLVGAAWLAATGHGCASEQDEGDYTTPPNFSLQQTRQVAMQGENFARDEQNQLRTSTFFARKAARKLAKLDESVSQDIPGQRGRLEATFHGSYAEGLTVAASTHPGASLRVVPVSAQKAPARLRNDGAVVSFENAFPSVTSAYGGRDSKLEEFLVIHSENDIPSLAYDLFPGDDFARLEEEDGRLWAYAKDGAGLFTIEPPFADDAAGKHVSGSWKLISNGSGYRIVADINLRGLQFPVLLDPTFEVPRWFRNTTGQPSARAAAAGAFDPNTNCSLVFGGATNSSFNLAQDLNIRCADRAWKTGLTPATAPPARAYAAMAYHGGSTNRVFLFGGYGATSVLNDLWRADLTCTTPGVTSSCSVAWTKITTTGGPSARFLHGMAWNGSRLMVFGGVNGAGSGLRDTWEYNADTNAWTQKCATCFGESFGFYGFASATLVNGGTRTVYASGGYNNPKGGGAFLNSVYRWNGSTWEDASGNDAVIPVSSAGLLANGQPLNPAPRYLHWMAATGTSRFLIGSGLSGDGSNYEQDTWLWQDRASEGFGNQWLRDPTPATASLPNAPGARESATAIYDENKQEAILLGGLDATQNPTGNARVYQAQERSFSLEQSCTDGNNDLLCDGNAVTLKATFPGLDNTTTPLCSDMQVSFLKFDALGGTWGAAGAIATAAFSGGACTASVSTTWDPSTFTDYGARARDKRFVLAGTGCTSTSATQEITAGSPKPGCIGATSTMGSASCGFAVDPSFGLLSTTCDNF